MQSYALTLYMQRTDTKQTPIILAPACAFIGIYLYQKKGGGRKILRFVASACLIYRGSGRVVYHKIRLNLPSTIYQLSRLMETSRFSLL